MAAIEVVARLSGLATFTDGSVKSMAATLDENGVVSVNLQSENDETAALANTQTGVFGFETNGLGDAVSNDAVVMDIDTADDESPVVTKFVAEFSGRVAYDDGSCGDFLGQYDGTPISFVDWDSTHLVAALAVSRLSDKLNALLAAFTGDDGATIVVD